jgi:ATP-binding cassette subfamily B protein
MGMAEYCVGPAMAVDWGEGDGEEEPQVCITRGLVTRAFSYFRPYWRRGLIALGCIAVTAALGLVPAIVAKRLIDYLSGPGAQFSNVLVLVGIAVLAGVFSGLIGVALAYLDTTISQGIMFDLRQQLFHKLLGQSMAFFTRSRTGDVMSRIGNDVGRIDDVVSTTVFGVARSVFVVVATLAFMFWLDWQLSLVAIVGLPLAVIPTRRIGRAAYQARQRTQRKVSHMTAYLQEVLGISGILLVKAFAKERSERARFNALNEDLRRLEVRQAMISNWFGMMMTGLIAAGPAALWLYGSYLVINGSVSLGTLVILGTVLTMRLYGSVADLASLNVNVVSSLALFQRLFEYLDMPVEVADAPGAHALGAVRGAVSFESVTFSYRSDSRPALDAVSFEVEPGQLVALVGPSGAGKTTTSYLVPRLYDPQAGTIRVDGQDLRKVTLESLRTRIGVVFQDTFMFHTSIRENLLYARPEATQDELVAAASAANLHEFVESLPEGYDTVVGERGHRLSGGEKQRLAIARAILKDPPILVLDEATSHLDTVSEQLIQEALRPLFASRTSIVIAHRLSTILAADQILVFEHGHILESGSHSELLAHRGLYAALYERQFKSQQGRLARASTG